jgi:hypothetical protein
VITTSTSHIDLTVAKALEENQNIAFIGTQKGGKFDIKYDLAKKCSMNMVTLMVDLTQI